MQKSIGPTCMALFGLIVKKNQAEKGSEKVKGEE